MTQHFVQNKFYLFLGSIFTAILFINCNKTFDEPPLNADPDIPVNMTIAELKSGYQTGKFRTIEEDKIITGVVVADDRSGNFFKQIVIQDETGGIVIQLDGNNVYTTYPVGRRLFVKLKGLMLGDYGGTPQIGLDSSRSDDGRYLNLGRIPSSLFDKYIVAGSLNNDIQPKLVTSEDFTKNPDDPLLSTLLILENEQFKDADLQKTYADTTKTESAINFTLENCAKKNIVLRNSSYASFAGVKVPKGKGTITAVASVFNGTVQLTIRDTNDVDFSAERCDGTTPVDQQKTIQEILNYTQGDSTIPSGVFFEGVVISDSKNESALNYRLQDETVGIQIRFAGNNADIHPALGDQLKVWVGGLKLGVFNGGLQIDKVETAEKIGAGEITPREATIADVFTNRRSWESTVVRLSNVKISGSGSNYTLQDASGTITTYVRATSGITMPDSAGAVVGYVSVYKPNNGEEVAQLVLRTQDDIVNGINIPDGPDEGIDLGSASSYLINFDNIGNGLPEGVKLYTNADQTHIGDIVGFNTAKVVWNNTAGDFKNFASAEGLNESSDADAQNAHTNRALGLRQTTNFGDEGAAFVFQLKNTTGKSSIKLEFQLQQLIATGSGRTTTWIVDYGTGNEPASFTPIATTPTLLTTSLGTFKNEKVMVTLPAAVDNQSGKVWIRIITLHGTSGSGSRACTAIDDVKFSW